jgi:hypothetical protein
MFQPNACRLGREVHAALRDRYGPALDSRFSQGIWSGAAWNFPPKAVSVPHRDSNNPHAFPCVVSAGGDFDADVGGMIVLWDLGIFVRFPPTSTVMLTSGDCTHFNVPVRPTESRWSVTQYMAGPLITWVRRRFRKESELTAAEKAEERSARMRRGESRHLYSTVSELEEDRRQLLKAERSFL